MTDDTGLLLPHPPEILKTMVLFSLRIGNVEDLSKWLPQARLRPHVVLKLCIALLDVGYPFKGSAATLREQFRKQVAERYPDQESHLPESQRVGTIPPLVEAAILESLRSIPGRRDAGIGQKHATPEVAPMRVSLALEDLRASTCFPDRNSSLIAAKDSQELIAMQKHYLLRASTDVPWPRMSYVLMCGLRTCIVFCSGYTPSLNGCFCWPFS